MGFPVMKGQRDPRQQLVVVPVEEEGLQVGQAAGDGVAVGFVEGDDAEEG
jgi:hypothetical protein